MPIKKAMVLGAGFGQRARPLSLVRPKPLFPVLNRPAILYVFDLLQQAGVSEVIVNTHHLAGRLEAYLKQVNLISGLRTIREEVILGTGGGVKNAEPFFRGEPFILINADVIAEVDLKKAVADHLNHGAWATLVMHDHPRFNQVFVDERGFIQGFGRLRLDRVREFESAGYQNLAFTGLSVISPKVLAAIPPGPGDIIAVYQSLIEAGRPIRAYVPDRLTWWDIGSPSDYLAVHQGLLASRGRKRLLLGPKASVAPEAHIEGWAVLGPGARVAASAKIKNSVLWPGARVAAGVKVVDSVLADNAVVECDLVGEAIIGTEVHPDHDPGQALNK